jgi:hypothetical protein
LLDIVLPIPLRNAALAPDAITAIASNTDHPFNLILMIDGGVVGDYAELQRFLVGFDHPWKLLHNNPAVGLNQSIREGLENCREKITAIIGPEVRLMDPSWFTKIKQIFDREPITGVIDTAPNTRSATLYPVKRAQNRHPLPGCRFMIVQTAFAKKTPPYGDVDPAVFWSRMASSQGGASWHAGAVRYAEVEHEDHELQTRQLGVRG